MENEYKGELLNNKADGYGVLEGSNYNFEGVNYNFVYIGQFRNGMKNGTGILQLLSEYVSHEELVSSFDGKRKPRPSPIHEFVGVFKDDLFTGEGLLYTDYGRNVYYFEDGMKRMKLK